MHLHAHDEAHVEGAQALVGLALLQALPESVKPLASSSLDGACGIPFAFFV
jgi:hypothetical protein